jgi:hypothetical protein
MKRARIFKGYQLDPRVTRWLNPASRSAAEIFAALWAFSHVAGH